MVQAKWDSLKEATAVLVDLEDMANGMRGWTLGEVRANICLKPCIDKHFSELQLPESVVVLFVPTEKAR